MKKHDEYCERQLAKIAAENMRLREAEAKYLPVVEKLVEAARIVEKSCGIESDYHALRHYDGIMALREALAAPLLGEKK